MYSITDIFNLLLKSIFVGFGFVMPILSLVKTSNLQSLKVKGLFVLTAIQAVRVAGILFFILAVVNNLDVFRATNASGENPGLDFILYMFFSPIMILLLTQLFWIKKLYMKKPALITLSILLLVLPSASFLLFVKTADYNAMASSLFNTQVLLAFLLNIIVFIFITFTIILLGGKLKDKST